MSAQSLLSYYPTYSILDEVVSLTGTNHLNIFLDLKNNLQTLYMQHSILNIIENSLKSNKIDTSVFSSILSFLTFHKIYQLKRNIKINFYIFFETGQSYYHTNISKKYKISRKVDNLYDLEKEKRDYFFEILQKNFLLTERALNKFPNIKVIRLPHLEADFIPYYLIKNKLVKDSTNIIYSNDHDMLQCLILDKTFIFYKTGKVKKLIRKGEIFKHYLKLNKDVPDEYLPLVMAIIGDAGDDIDGVHGIGPNRLVEFLDELITNVGGMNTLFDNVQNGKPIFNSSVDKNKNKYMNLIIEKEVSNSIISKNLKLVSFELLGRTLDNPPSTELADKKKLIMSVLNDNTVSELEPMREVLERFNVFFTDELDSLFYTPNLEDNQIC